MMKQDIKIFIRQERQKYVSPSVKVIEVAAQRVICGSGDIDNFNLKDDDTSNWQ